MIATLARLVAAVASRFLRPVRAGTTVSDSVWQSPLADRLMAHLDGRYLSLALPAPPDD